MKRILGEIFLLSSDEPNCHRERKTLLKLRHLCLVLTALVTWLPISLIAQTKSDGSNAKTSVVRVPFVGCPSSGQGGSNPAPVARVFPTQREFAESVIKEGIEPASDFPFGPYPTDTLKYHGDVTVEFQTPANTKGLGTEFGLQPNDEPISGVAAIKWDGEDIYLVCLTVRLMPDTRDLTTQIIQQFERDQKLP